MTNKNEPYNILIVEDEEVNFFCLKVLLNDVIALNCKLFHSENGKEAVDVCRTNPAIDFVFMDIKMPIMNGHEATTIIKALRPQLPIVAQTAYSTSEDREKAISAGCDDFITKPIGQEDIEEVIKKYLTKN